MFSWNEAIGSASPGLEGESFLEELDARALPGLLLGVFGGVAGDLLDDVVEVDDRPGEAIHGSDDDMVAVADVPDQRLQLRAVRRALAGLLLGEDLVALPHRLELPGEVLSGRRDPDVRDALSRGAMR